MPAVIVRPYVPDDLPAVRRAWHEVGWIDKEDDPFMEPFFADPIAWVGEVDGEAEAVASAHRGAMRYEDADLDLCVVTSVVTSRVGRKKGLARQLAARVMAQSAEDGAEMAILGMFEQGFYDRLGFGSGPYEHQFRFDPATLTLDRPYRTPVRIGADDLDEAARVHAGRMRGHGGVRIPAPGFLKAETTQGFGLGYRNEIGDLTHFLWVRPTGEFGPYRVSFVAYRSIAELLDLLVLLRSLGDQVRMVHMQEPPELQLQDLIRHPFRQQTSTRGGEFEVTTRSSAWWQARILDLPACVARRSWSGPPVEFNLSLSDPVAEVLTSGWQGVGGDWVVSIGEESRAVPGRADDLPTLNASVNAFTRLFLGVLSAGTLSHTDRMSGPDELVAALDRAFAIGVPRPGMFF